MDDFLDIATSLCTNSLTFFVGTGFSKYMTNGLAPNWLELLVECTKAIDKDDKLLNQLFNSDTTGLIKEAKFDLTVCAQILEVEYLKKRSNIKEKVSVIIREKINEHTIDKDKLIHIQTFFSKHPNVNIVTTNFDTLFSEFVIPLTSRVIIEGSTIPRINSGQNIYHIHGYINKPSSLVLTISDYYNFQNNNNYFSRKFFTLLQETTVAIVGYSLGDFNLNSILNEVKSTKRESFRKTDLYYVTKDAVSELMEKFYSMTYAIRVIEGTQINRFLDSIESEYDKAKDLIDSVGDLKEVISGTKEYTDDFLKLRISLPTILVQAASIGIESNDKRFIKTLLNLLKKKKDFTSETGAWLQYEHLADWLIEIASIVTIQETDFEEEFCEIAEYSFRKSSRRLYFGYSWFAWKEWNTRWQEMKLENQLMLQELIETNHWDKDLEITEIYK